MGMKRIGIDARLYGQTGVGVYLRNLLHYLDLCAPENYEFFIYASPYDIKRITFKSKNFVIREAGYPWHSFSEQIGFAALLAKDRLDLMHFTYFSYPVVYRASFIATVHDVTPLSFKTGKASTRNPLIFHTKHLAFRFVLKNQIKHAKAIITPTQWVKQELVRLYGGHYADKTYPLYEGVDYALLHAKETVPSHRKEIGEQFFIYVGNFYPHKNVERLVYAYAKQQTDVKLILIGPRDYFSFRLLKIIRALGMSRAIQLRHVSSKEELVFFYRHALGLIHPSLSEGFGLPIVEAAYFNLPIIASDIPVFHELLDKEYLSFNPYDTEDMASKIKKFLDEKKRFTYGQLLKKCSFERMTHHTLNLYQRCL